MSSVPSLESQFEFILLGLVFPPPGPIQTFLRVLFQIEHVEGAVGIAFDEFIVWAPNHAQISVFAELGILPVGLLLSGRKAGPRADLYLTQWPHLAGPDGPEYAGRGF